MHASTQPQLPTAGDHIGGRFHLIQLCGESPIGWLYDALDEQTGQVVRLRLPKGSVDPVRLGIQHPTLARHLGVADGGDYLVMEDLDGAPLLLTRQGSPLLRVYEVAAQVLPLFAELHAHGVVHGSVGLHSLWRDIDGHTRVVDLGITAALEPDTLPYAPPERRTDGHVDARSDVWALATLLLSIAAGDTSGAAPLPDDVVQVFARARHERPVFRFADAGAFWRDLQPALTRALDAAVVPHDEDATSQSSPTLDPLADLPSLPPAPERTRTPSPSRWPLVFAALAASGVTVLIFATFAAGILSTLFLLA